MIALSKLTDKGGIPVWIEDSQRGFILSPEFILGYIDVNDKAFVDNLSYKEKRDEDYFKLAKVQDRSYEVEIGKLLEITIPLDEQELYDRDLEL